MKVSAAILSLATIASAAVASSALAADMYGKTPGGMKGYGAGAVAVPAPVPYEETFKWYIRGDIGFALKGSGSFDYTGLPYNMDQPDEWAPRAYFSVGAGRYLTPNFRTEFTVDMRGNNRLDNGVNGQQLVSQTMTASDGTNSVTNIYATTRSESIAHQNSTFLLSAYYDINRMGRFRPYIGAGIGVAMHQIERTSSESSVCTGGTTTDVATGAPIANGCDLTTGLPAGYALATTSDNGIGVGLAAQISAGVSYAITPRTHWDLGYRMLWQSGSVGITNGTLTGASTFRVGNYAQHELRTGIRLDLY